MNKYIINMAFEVEAKDINVAYFQLAAQIANVVIAQTEYQHLYDALVDVTIGDVEETDDVPDREDW